MASEPAESRDEPDDLDDESLSDELDSLGFEVSVLRRQVRYLHIMITALVVGTAVIAIDSQDPDVRLWGALVVAACIVASGFFMRARSQGI